MNPFPLSTSDREAFMSSLNWGTLYSLPQWGGIFEWQNRYILVFPKPNGDYALTDVSGGIPDSSVPGGMIPIASVIKNIPKTQTSSLAVFFYSLPSNFMAVAKEDAIAVASGAGEILSPLLPAFSLTAIIVLGVLAFIYLPRPRS